MTLVNAATADRPASLRRSGFALSGPTRKLDPRHFARRADLADVRLADRVFAPHYAAPVMRRVTAAAALTADAAGDDTLANLAEGETFELLDVTAGRAWGIAPAHDLVGYVDAVALGKSGT